MFLNHSLEFTIMRTLIVGGNGMLGHTLLGVLGRHFDIRATLRNSRDSYPHNGTFSEANTIEGILLGPTDNLKSLTSQIISWEPQIIINAAGVVKQRPEAENAIESISVNSLLPHQLAKAANLIKAKLIHFSTDCVFAGTKGMYREKDLPDGTDLYGRSKLLGEVTGARCLTLRTSLVGRELAREGRSLFEWFLAQKKSARGYTNAIFSGFTTLEIARIVLKLITEHPDAEGLWHLASEPISKYNLLMLVKKRLSSPIDIIRDDSIQIDRSLDGSRFQKTFKYNPPDWPTMVDDYFTFLEGKPHAVSG